MAFHSIRGWYFERSDDGRVRIEKRDVDNNVVAGVELPAATWCSAVASVSANGETGRTFAAATALHEGEGPFAIAQDLAEAIALRRNDTEFMDRLRHNMEKHADLLDRLAADD